MSKCEYCCYSKQVVFTEAPIEDKITQIVCNAPRINIEYICTVDKCKLNQDQIQQIIKLKLKDDKNTTQS